MLIAIDIGNTSISFGFFKGSRLVRSWRLPTKEASAKTFWHIPRRRTQDTRHKANFGVCISSVVPRLNPILSKVIRRRFGCKPFFVTAKNAGIKIPRYSKKQIGADRLANAVAAHEKFKRPCIVIDMGTATTFDYVTGKGEYGGGVIAPGIGIINDALYEKTAKLPKVQIRMMKRVIAQNTRDGMRSGVFHGYMGLVDHIVNEMKKEITGDPIVIATGGLATIISKCTKTIHRTEPFLTLEGLKIIWERNR